MDLYHIPRKKQPKYGGITVCKYDTFKWRVVFPDGSFLTEEKFIYKSDLDGVLEPGPWTGPIRSMVPQLYDHTIYLDRNGFRALDIVEAFENWTGPSPKALDRGDLDALNDVLSTLSPRNRDLARAVIGYKIPQAGLADLYCTTQGNVSHQLKTIVKVLKERLRVPVAEDKDWDLALDWSKDARVHATIPGPLAIQIAKCYMVTGCQMATGETFGLAQCVVRNLMYNIIDLLKSAKDPGLSRVRQHICYVLQHPYTLRCNRGPVLSAVLSA